VVDGGPPTAADARLGPSSAVTRPLTAARLARRSRISYVGRPMPCEWMRPTYSPRTPIAIICADEKMATSEAMVVKPAGRRW
jgi:hypothetical protein